MGRDCQLIIKENDDDDDDAVVCSTVCTKNVQSVSVIEYVINSES